MDFVYLVDGKDYGRLKAVLEADPIGKQSFATIGYTLRESKSLGLKGGSYAVYFKCEDESLAASLKEKLRPLESAKELEGPEKQEIISKIQGDEDSAAAGFGNIFG